MKQCVLANKDEFYNSILEYWETRGEFKIGDDIPSIPRVLPQDYKGVIIPNIIRCGGIPKDKLVIGKTYIGDCRNGNEATWDGKNFVYLRTKFGTTFQETINHFEDDNDYDLFIPIKEK